MAQEVVITYETLFELLQREKDRAEIQKLDENYFTDLINYIKDKKKLLMAPDDSPFAKDEIKKTERQLENIYKLIKDLYERREKKIINLAIDKSRTNSNLIDTSALLKEEKVFFDAVSSALDTYRMEILNNVMNDKVPFMENLKPTTNEAKNLKDKVEKKDEVKETETKVKNTKLVRFVEKVEKFVGPELEEYGPFDSEDIANLPGQVAEILIGDGKAEEMQEG